VTQPSPALHDSAATRERILDVSERLFAERGILATSVREITATAGCNLAAVSYYFGGKENLYREVFARRLGGLREQRLESIRRTLDAAGQAATLELLLRQYGAAFLEPLVGEGGGPLLMRLISRELIEPHLPDEMFAREVIEPVHEAFAGALMRLCPGLTAASARRCSHSVVGLLVNVLHVGRCLGDSGPACRLPAMIEHVVLFAAAGIRAAAAADRAAPEVT
jgi:AcrR family transcriptional regulator